ncbi:MAG: AAA family ATPase [Candidatus Nanohaloarchaea archaeon]|nr:AAA family ATPase [Candidatus Nanohaloarchaea archaeon]
MQIYGVTGMPLAGKTTVAAIIQQQGYKVLDMGDVVRTEMEERGIEPGNEGSFVSGQREEKGSDAIAQLSVPYLEDLMDKTQRIVITGMRGWDEKQRFEEETGATIDVIAVWASRGTRKHRREERQREEDVKGQAFNERDRRELEQGVGDLMALSDHLIRNDGISLEELEERVAHLIE